MTTYMVEAMFEGRVRLYARANSHAEAIKKFENGDDDDMEVMTEKNCEPDFSTLKALPERGPKT